MIVLLAIGLVGVLASMQFLPRGHPDVNYEIYGRVRPDSSSASYHSSSGDNDSDAGKRNLERSLSLSDLVKILCRKLEAMPDKQLRKESREGYFKPQAYEVRKARVLEKYTGHNDRKKALDQARERLSAMNPYKIGESDLKNLKRL